MKAAMSLAGAVLLSRAPAGGAVGEQPNVIGSRPPPMVSSWTKGTNMYRYLVCAHEWKHQLQAA